MSSQHSGTSAPAVRRLECIAVDPGVEGISVSPTGNDDDLVRAFGAQDLHRDEPWELLHEPPTVREPLDDLIDHSFFHRQLANNSDHPDPLVVGVPGG